MESRKESTSKISPVKARLEMLNRSHTKLLNVKEAKYKLRRKFYNFGKHVIEILEEHSTPDTGRQIAFLDGLRGLYDVAKQAAAIPSYDKFLEQEVTTKPIEEEEEVEFVEQDEEEDGPEEVPATQTF